MLAWKVLNCTVRMTPPTQAPNSVLTAASTVTGLPKSAITIYPMFMGGGLGRKFEQDYVTQAIRTVMAVGRPVKLTWPREEDMARDQYRPMAVTRIKVALDSANNITGFTLQKVACVVDCGTAVNPNSVEAQMQGGIFHALSAAKWRELKWTAGKSSVKDFNKFRRTSSSSSGSAVTASSRFFSSR